MIEEQINKQLARIDKIKLELNNAEMLGEMESLKQQLNSNSSYVDIYRRLIESSQNNIARVESITEKIKNRIDFYENKYIMSLIKDDAMKLVENNELTDEEIDLICMKADKTDFPTLGQGRWIDLPLLIRVVKNIKQISNCNLIGIDVNNVRELVTNLKNENCEIIGYYRQNYKLSFSNDFTYIFKPFDNSK